MVLDEGQVLDGKYVIVRILATGSMAEVYLGRNERIGKEVAVKVLRRDFADDRAIVNRFEQEARIATAVRSSHVVDVYDLGELPSGERFIVMEYVDGESLEMRMAREGKLSARVLGGITLQILDGLIAAHAAGVIHRDLKPENVILSKRDGQDLVKLVDFGVSRRCEPGARRDLKRATLDGMLLGTPMFMSPEQARGEADGVDHRTDIFSLGVSMYEALSGEVPFNGDNVVSLLSRVMNDPEVPLEKHVPNVDPGLARIVRKAMAKDPKDRYQTAAEMREAVAAWCAVFESTSALRSSLEGIARALSPSMPDEGPFHFLGVTIDRKRARAIAAAAAIAAAFAACLTRPTAPPAPVEIAAPAAPPHSDPLVVPTTPVVITPTRQVPTVVTAAQLPALPVAVTPVKKSTVAAPSTSPNVAPSRLAKSTRPGPVTHPHNDGDASAPATASAARDGAAIALAPKTEEAAPSPPPSASASDTPPPDPPSIP